MKIYNKKGFFRGLVCFTIFILGITAMFTKGFTVKLSILSTLLFLFAITDLSRSLSKTASLEDLLADSDERDRYILLKTSHKSLQILKTIDITLTILFMIGYAITKNNILLGAFIITSIYITVTFIVTIAVNIYYEKHE